MSISDHVRLRFPHKNDVRFVLFLLPVVCRRVHVLSVLFYCYSGAYTFLWVTFRMSTAYPSWAHGFFLSFWWIPIVHLYSFLLWGFYAPATKSRGHINLPLFLFCFFVLCAQICRFLDCTFLNAYLVFSDVYLCCMFIYFYFL